ncbi:MAG: hypothetical protein CEE41_04360 [Hadesarchaea archaeon B3_Hades]|nr:MAG: hypothetical protein CEE41_04360 [Hadesarchaea archaeon B3_Hades]
MSIASQYVTGRKVIILIYPWVFQEANIFSTYSLCVSAPVELTASPSSEYVVSLLVVELVGLFPAAVYGFCKVANSVNVAVLASTYDLSSEAP